MIQFFNYKISFNLLNLKFNITKSSQINSLLNIIMRIYQKNRNLEISRNQNQKMKKQQIQHMEILYAIFYHFFVKKKIQIVLIFLKKMKIFRIINFH